MKIVHHMQCRTSQICTCVASSSVIATITLIDNRGIYMPTHTDIYMPTLADIYMPTRADIYMPTRADMHLSARPFVEHARIPNQKKCPKK